MAKLSFGIAVNLLTDNFKKGANTVKNSFRSMQAQILTFAAALGAGGIGVAGLLSRFKEVATETSRVLTALKNVSGGTKGFSDSLSFLNQIAAKYGLEINGLVGNFAKFTASATQANMPMEEQRKIFESMSRTTTAFALSADEANGVFLALSQMMSKGKISSEELRLQMGERLPIALQAMAKAAGTSVAGLDKLMKQGKVMSADVLPKFAKALDEMIPDVDTDNLQTSLNRLSNTFGNIVNASGFQDKYKALIDSLNNLLQTASRNVQNIVIGIVAAIGFVVTNGLTKVYRGYAATGNQIVANATVTHNKLRAAIAARVETEIALEKMKLQYSLASETQRYAMREKLAAKETALAARNAQVNIAFENAKSAAAQAAAVKSGGAWATGWAAITGSAKKLMLSLKAMWNTFAPAIIVSAIIAIVGHFKNLFDEANRIKSIFSDYKKELESIKPGDEVVLMEKLQGIVKDVNRSLEDRKTALNSLNKMLGTNFTIDSKTLKINGDINAKIAERIGLLKAQAQAEYLTKKIAETEGKRDELYQEKDKLISEERQPHVKGKALVRSMFGHKFSGLIGMDTPEAKQREIDGLTKVLNDANEKLEKAILAGGLTEKNQITTPVTNDEPDEKAQKAAEKRLEALRKLDEADRQRQTDKLKFDLDLRQKEIDSMDDSFSRQIKQTALNLDRERAEIEDYQSDMLKQQNEFLKNKYVSEKGTAKGFEAYFKNLQKADFKGKDGKDVLPEGLRSQDIEGQVSKMLGAARAAQQKGLQDINKDMSAMLLEQRLIFASDLEKRLSDIDAYYNEQRIKAGDNAELIKAIESARGRAKEQATVSDTINKLDFNEQIEQERVNGLESIGMTELVEAKKLEITKRYLQLRIDALKDLAAAGDEEAQRQLKESEASLKKLDVQKPAKTLKGLADKAIFNTIQKGFEKAGDSAEVAEAKTASLLGSIAQKAQLVGSVVSTLQSAFGGLDESLDLAFETVGNIANGFAQGGIVGGIASVVGEGMKLFSKASEAAARHRKALKEIDDARIASQRAYNLLLLEQNLLLKEAVSIFGEKQISRANNAIKNYRDSIGQLRGELQGDEFKPDSNYENQLKDAVSKGGLTGRFAGANLEEYRRKVDNYNKGIQKLGQATIVTGHKKTGMFGLGKGKDVYDSILNEYTDVINAEGKLNTERLRTIIDTRKMSDETKSYLQNLINLQEAAEKAQEELRDYLQTTFSSLGTDIMTSLEEAIKDKGVDAWESFGAAGAKVIEALGRQIAYELFFADKFKGLQKQLEDVYGSDKSEKEIAQDAMDLIGGFYQNIGSQMELAQGFMENWKKEAEKYGLDLWKGEDKKNTQDATKGYSVSMDQETGGAILGRITGIYESILEVKSMLSGAVIDTAKSLSQVVIISDELKKHTGMFYEMQQMQTKAFRVTQTISEDIASLLEIKDDLSSISKNTKGLAPK